jgi:hypothetical protein
MKTKITKQTKQTKPFPKLMIDKDGDVFFMMLERKESGKCFGYGVLIHSVSTDAGVGAYSEKWDLSLFEDFDGTVELSN